jgi:hypothetical protein
VTAYNQTPPADDEAESDEPEKESGESGDDEEVAGEPENTAPSAPASNAAQNRDEDEMLALRISRRERLSEAPGCSPAYRIVNDTSQPIRLPEGRRHPPRDVDGDLDDERRDREVVRPGESEVVCAEHRGGRSFDYYSPHPEADIPPHEAEFVARTVKIRLKD